MYQISDKIVHPLHGAGIIEDIVSKHISGETIEYYVLRLSSSSVTVMIPVKSSDSIGLRAVISCEEAQNVLCTIPTIAIEDDANWNRRYRDNMDRIKSGNLLEVACVIKSLMARELRKPLSTGERKMLSTAKQILFSELVLATGLASEEIEKIVRESISQ